MSEPNQLYARVRLSRERLDAFLASPLPDVSEDEAVLEWLSAAEYYGPRYTPELIRDRADGDSTIAQWVDWLMEPAPHGTVMPGRNDYDDATQTWTLAALDFSENYDDYINAVAVFREIAKYKDLPGDDFLLIYGYLFEDGALSVAMKVEMGAAAFIEESQTESLLPEADAMMEALIAEGAAGSEG